jgi:hypothetical protein
VAVWLRQFYRLIINQRDTHASVAVLRLGQSDRAAVAAILGVAGDQPERKRRELAGAAGT